MSKCQGLSCHPPAANRMGYHFWASEAECQRLHHSHIWNVASAKVTTPKPHSSLVKRQGKRSAQRVEAKSGTKACTTLNISSCSKQEEHPNDLHICQYCLSTESRVCKHAERVCNHKKRNAHLN